MKVELHLDIPGPTHDGYATREWTLPVIPRIGEEITGFDAEEWFDCIRVENVTYHIDGLVGCDVTIWAVGEATPDSDNYQTQAFDGLEALGWKVQRHVEILRETSRV